MIDFMATRTAFFDEFFLAAVNAGVRQVVILGSGLDSRAWRLPWPDGTVVYELDQPKVLEFKSATLLQHGVQPTSRLVNVPIDLRQDWPKALQEAGFDSARPCAWSAEGLVRYLPARAQDLLFERIDALSPAGSRLASNVPGADFLNPDRMRRQREGMQRMRAVVARLVNTGITDYEDLWYAEERTNVVGWLRERGWDVSAKTFAELLNHYRRNTPESVENTIPPMLFLSAQRKAQR